jgi:uncharacterized lipoprotein
MSLDRAILVITAASLVSGCHMFSHWTNRITDCHRPQEYQRAVQAAPLKVPPGLDTPNTQGALVIPTVELAPPPPGVHDACLDAPPRYKPAPPNKAASS